MNPLALMAAISKSQGGGGGNGAGQPQQQTSREMSVAVELWASGISSKMEEIQRMSGAQVHVDTNSGPEVRLTMSGSEESVLLAQFLVQSNIDLIMKQRLQQNPMQPSQQQQLGSHAFDMQQQQSMQHQQWQGPPRGGGGRGPPPLPPNRGGRGGNVGGGRRGVGGRR